MSIGSEVYEAMKRRGLQSQFLYADLQALKGAADAATLRSFLESRGCPCEPDRQSALHFSDLIELWLARRTLKQAKVSLVLFSLS
ncbi:MAG: hypothetical protein HC813_04170 [Planctomycetes bacterium]|nr:hypothetical protein [Planctomycetota bacterium]